MKKIVLLMLFFHGFCLLDGKIKFSNKQSGISFGKTNSKLLLFAPLVDVNGKITFKDNDPNRVVSNGPLDVIKFDQGLTGTTGNEFEITGALEPAGVDLLTLRNGESLAIHGKTVNQTVRVVDNSTGSITGSPLFTTPVQLANGAVLNLGISSALLQPLSPEGSNALNLTASLRMNLNTALNSSVLNTVNLNGFELFFNNALSAIGSINGPGTVHFLRSSYQVASDLVFAGSATVNGQESVLNFLPTKSIKFGAGLYDLLDVEMRGMDFGSTFSIDSLGTVFLSNVTISLDGDMRLKNQGRIVVLGPNCKLISNGYKLQLDQGTRLTVDGVDLVYYPKNPFDPNPVEIINSGSGPGIIELLNGGRIVPSNLGVAIQDNQNIAATLFTASTNWQLTGSSNLIFQNSAPLVPKAVTFDGNGYFIQFPPGSSPSPSLLIAANTTVTMNNVTLKDFNPSAISFAAPTSKFEFGTNSVVQLNNNTEINSSFPWVFAGNSLIDAAGKTIVLNAANALQVKNGSTVTLNNAHLVINNPGAFFSNDNSSSFCFQDCIITLKKDGLNLASGNYFAKGLVQVFGADQTAVLGSAKLSFSSTGNFIVNTASQLNLNRGVVFEYKANPALNGNNTAATRRHFKLADPSAKLLLNGCSLISTATSLALDYGTVYVVDKVEFSVSTAIAAEAEFGSDLLLEILAGGNLDVNGPLRYITSTFVP